MPYADPEKKKAAHARWRSKNRDKVGRYYQKRRARVGQAERDRINNRASYARNAVNEKSRKAKTYLENKDIVLARNKKWKLANRDKMRLSDARLRASDPERFRLKSRNDQKRRRQYPSNKIVDSLRKRIWSVLRSGNKSASTAKLLGCSFENFKLYLESKFTHGMTWANYGTFWELDHIMPCAIFDLDNPEHQRRCFHFSNHQPLEKFENRSKGANVLSNQFPLL